MKKNYIEPELNVLHIGKEIRTTDIIAVSNTSFSIEDNVGAPGQRGLDDWYEGY